MQSMQCFVFYSLSKNKKVLKNGLAISSVCLQVHFQCLALNKYQQEALPSRAEKQWPHYTRRRKGRMEAWEITIPGSRNNPLMVFALGVFKCTQGGSNSELKYGILRYFTRGNLRETLVGRWRDGNLISWKFAVLFAHYLAFAAAAAVVVVVATAALDLIGQIDCGNEEHRENQPASRRQRIFA